MSGSAKPRVPRFRLRGFKPRRFGIHMASGPRGLCASFRRFSCFVILVGLPHSVGIAQSPGLLGGLPILALAAFSLSRFLRAAILFHLPSGRRLGRASRFRRLSNLALLKFLVCSTLGVSRFAGAPFLVRPL